MAQSEKTTKETKRGNRWKQFLTWFTLLALVLLVYFSRHKIAETINNLGNVNLFLLLLIIVWQIANYHSYAKLYQGLFAILGKKMAYKSMYRSAVELNFVNHVFPSAGVSGFSYFGLRMGQYGATPGQATLVQTMRFVTVFISFQAILLLGVFALAAKGEVSNLAIFVATGLSTGLTFSTIAIAYVIGSKRRINAFFTTLTRAVNALIRIVRPKHPEAINVDSVQKLFLDFHENYRVLRKNYIQLKWPLIWSFFATLTEILTLYAVYMAFDNYVNFGAVIIAYAVANFASLISVLPGGIGVYEGLMTAVLATVGVPPSESLPATVMYRILSSVVQLPPGYYLYHKALNDKKNPLVG